MSLKVSIVMPLYNMARFLPEAVESVLLQTHPDWELLIVDDGSTDGSAELARGLAQESPQRIRCLEHPARQNRGISATRNLGIRQATGDLIAFLDADDVWMPLKLERQLELLDRHPQAEVVWGATIYWGSWENLPDHVPDLRLPGHQALAAPMCLLSCYPLGLSASPSTSCMMVRRQALLKSGGFEEAFRGRYELYEDQSLFMKLFLHCTVVVSHEVWSRYRLHRDSCCAVNEGNAEIARGFFLRWLRGYLLSERVYHPRIWLACWKAWLKLQLRRLLKPWLKSDQTPAARRAPRAW